MLSGEDGNMPKKKLKDEQTDKPTKCDGAETEERVCAIIEHIVDGWSTRDIVQYCAENYEIKARRTHDLIALAKERLREVNNEEIETSIAFMKSALLKVYKKSGEIFQTGDQLKALAQLSKILGLDSETVILKDKRELSKLGDDELDDLINGR